MMQVITILPHGRQEHVHSEASTFPIVIIFFRGCVPEMFAVSGVVD